MKKLLEPARRVAPGRILLRELETRLWTAQDMARITGCSTQTIDEIIKGTKEITPATAEELAKAFGTSTEFWMKLASS